MLVGQRRAALAAEGPAHLGRRAMPRRVASDKREALESKSEPGNRLGTGCSTAGDAMADRRYSGPTGYPVAHLTAQASAVAHLLPPHSRVPSQDAARTAQPGGHYGRRVLSVPP